MTALDLAERALAAVPGEEAEAVVSSELSGFARYAGSEVHQPTLVENHVVQLRVARDGRVGGASTNRTGDEALRELAQRTLEAVATAPSDETFPGFAPAAEPPVVQGYDEATAELPPAEQAQIAAQAIAAARPLELYGYVTSGVVELAVATSAGVAAEDRMTDANVVALAAGKGVSGYAERQAVAIGSIDAAETAEEALRKAEATRGGAELEPRAYRAVLEPYAFAELLEYFAQDSFNGLGLLEQSSYFAGRIGDGVFAPNISIAEDPLDPAGLPKSLDFEGTPDAASRSSRRASRAASSGTAARPPARERSRPGMRSPSCTAATGRRRSRSQSQQATRARSRSSTRRSATGSTSRACTTSRS